MFSRKKFRGGNWIAAAAATFGCYFFCFLVGDNNHFPLVTQSRCVCVCVCVCVEWAPSLCVCVCVCVFLYMRTILISRQRRICLQLKTCYDRAVVCVTTLYQLYLSCAVFLFFTCTWSNGGEKKLKEGRKLVVSSCFCFLRCIIFFLFWLFPLLIILKLGCLLFPLFFSFCCCCCCCWWWWPFPWLDLTKASSSSSSDAAAAGKDL